MTRLVITTMSIEKQDLKYFKKKLIDMYGKKGKRMASATLRELIKDYNSTSISDEHNCGRYEDVLTEYETYANNVAKAKQKKPNKRRKKNVTQ